MAEHQIDDPLEDYDPGEPLPFDDEAGSPYELSPFATDVVFSDDPGPEPMFDDAPPPYDDTPPRFDDVPPRNGGYDRHSEPDDESESEDLAVRVLSTLRDCVAAQHGRSASEIVEMMLYAMASTQVLDYLDKKTRQVYARLTEVLISEYGDDKGRSVDLRDVPDIDACNRKVQLEMKFIQARIGAKELPTTPTSAWKALVNFCQRMESKRGAAELIYAIERGDTDEDCMDVFRGIAPPTARKSLQNASFSRTAGEWEAADLAAEAQAGIYRISSGYPTLDYAFTLKDARGRDAEPRGAYAPGEFHVIGAPTGNGKSAFARRIITSGAEDLVNGWGFEHAKVLIAITEEAPKIVYKAAGLGSGQRFHHLKDNVVIANVGASRRRFIHAIWDQVIEAFHKAQDTGMPITATGLPYLIILDYVGGLIEAGEGADTTAIEKTANLIMRGLCAWDVQMMEEFSGENFAAYAGMSWPEGMENFKPAVIGFSQFRKLADPLWYDPNSKAPMSDFVVENADGSPGWDLLPGDFRIPTQGELRGSGVLVNHATSLTVLHRSRPQNNPKIIDKETGRIRLADDRARIILVKVRNSADLPFIPMRFDSQPDGLRGQFYDWRAEKGIEKGKVVPTECWMEPGDPILPGRPVQTPFDGIAY